MNFLHYFQPNQILLRFGPITIYWYGFLIALAMAVAILIAWRLAKKQNLESDDLIDLAFWLIIGGIIGARLYDVFIIDWNYFSRHLREIFYLWTGGLAIHGAIIGGVLALFIWCKIKKQDIWNWLDLTAVVLPLAQAIGRWGNYFNQELFGWPTDLPWGISIAENLRPALYQSSQYFHPAFLYESILNFLLFIILFFVYQMSLRAPEGRGNPVKIGRDPHASSAGWRTSLRMTGGEGRIIGLYLIGYGLIRFFIEFIRIDETAMWLGVRAPQIISLLAIVMGVVILIRKNKNTSA
jgi:phosphatidylglycerol:prolipoprotein diacylglycerol transferase